MTRRQTVTAAVFVGAVTICGTAQQPAGPSGAGCTTQNQYHFICNRDAFQARLASARTVRIDVERLDVFARQQATKLVEDMGKQVAVPEQRADLLMTLLPVDRSGQIDFGPNAKPQGLLSVYDLSLGSGRRGLIWTETFDGQEGRPWPSIVTELLRRFQADTQTH